MLMKFTDDFERLNPHWDQPRQPEQVEEDYPQLYSQGDRAFLDFQGKNPLQGPGSNHGEQDQPGGDQNPPAINCLPGQEMAGVS